MPVHLAFLRAINLGKNRRVAMPDLVRWLEDDGFTDVRTYLATGNVRVTTAARSTSEVANQIESLVRERAGFEVPAIVLTPAELAAVHAEAGAQPREATRRYVAFLARQPGPEAAAELDRWAVPGEGARVSGRAVHWWLAHPTAQARLSNARIERLLDVPATTRDLKVVTTLAQRWASEGPR